MRSIFELTYKKTISLLLLLVIVILNNNLHAQFYTGSQMSFGKNRIKYDSYFWTYYTYERYDIYFYEEGKDLANYVSTAAKTQLENVERFFDYELDKKIQFIIYNKHSDYKQSNLGLSTEEEHNTGGVTRIVGTKVILYYEGDHAKLDAQIRVGLAQVIIDDMMYGGNVREKIKNNSLLNLPEWYIKGLLSYLESDWNTDIDNRIKDAVEAKKFKNINHLEGEDAICAGHAMWKYIADNYGEAVISNIIYITKINRNIDNASLFVVGLSIKNLWKECYQSFVVKYQQIDSTAATPSLNPIVLKPKVARVYKQVKVSPDGNYVLYTTNELGQYKLWLYDVQKKKSKRILKSGHKIDRINDYTFPLVAWHPNGMFFSYIIERKGYLVMTTYELETKERSERNITGFEKILDYSYNDDGKKFVMSAVKKGQTDIYVYTAASSGYDQITNDLYDDLTPRFVHNSKEIAFTSNRPGDTLSFDQKQVLPKPLANKDVFVFDNISKSHVLKRATNTPSIDETYPADYDNEHISYLSDLNGIRNRYIARFDSVIAYVDTAAHYRTIATSWPITNYSRSILEQDVNKNANAFTEVVFQNGKYKLLLAPIPTSIDTSKKLKNTSFRDYKNRLETKLLIEAQAKEQKATQVIAPVESVKSVVSIAESVVEDSLYIDIDNYVFETEKHKAKKAKEATQKKTLEPLASSKLDKEFVLSKQKNYNTSYSKDYLVTQLDNNFLGQSYQRFTGGGSPIYLNPGLNALIKIGASDLFEDYTIVGAMRFPSNLITFMDNNEFVLSYENRIGHLDKQLVLHRQTQLNPITDPDDYVLAAYKMYTNEVRYILKYPFSEVSSLRGSINYRNDKFLYKSVSTFELQKPSEYEHWGSLKLEYVFDNVLNKGLNLYNGIRGKVFGEYYQQLNKKETDFFVVGLDWRFYQKIHRSFIWANRVAASTSFGNRKLVYYMGGVDSWTRPKFDNTVNIDTDKGYAFQTLATNMRGFYQNARNGNSFAVINSELRFPVFKYFLKRPIRSDFIQNFQVITFGDIGTAWTELSPYSEKNSLNTTIIQEYPLEITLKTQNEPIIAGFGWGLRSRLFGYFVRADMAWGVKDGIILKRIWHLSLSLDF